MVMIPGSPGVRVGLSTQLPSAEPNIAQTQVIPQALAGLGQNIERLGQIEINREIREQEAYRTARLIEYKNKLEDFDNSAKIGLSEMAPDPQQFLAAKENLVKERDKFLKELEPSFADDPELSTLIKRQAAVTGNDLNFFTDKIVSDKKKEYNKNQIYGDIYKTVTNAEQAGSQAQLNNLGVSLQRTLDLGLRTGILDQKDIFAEKERFQARVEKRQKEWEDYNTSVSIANGQTLLDPHSADDRKIADKSFELYVSNSQNPDIAAEQFVTRTGIVPTQAKKVWSSQLNMGNPEQKITTATKMVDMIRKNPALANQFNSSDVDYVAALVDNLDTGAPASEVVKFADTSIAKVRDLDTKARLGLYNQKEYQKKIDSSYEDLVKTISDEPGFDLFKGEVAIPNSFKDEFMRQTKNALVAGKTSEDGAINAATAKIAAEWSVTNVGRRRLQRFAPERYYGQDSSWINEQLSEAVSKAQPGLSKNIKDLQLEPIPSSITSTGRPSYFITKENEFGGFDQVRDDKNLPVVFTPNVTQRKEYKKNKERLKKLNTERIKEAELELSAVNPLFPGSR